MALHAHGRVRRGPYTETNVFILSFYSLISIPFEKEEIFFSAMRTKNASLQNRLLFFPRDERFGIVGNKSSFVDKFQFLQGQKYECYETPLSQ